MSSTNRGTIRNVSDFYPTPPDAINNFINNYNIDMNNLSILEPAAGSGAIAKTIKIKYPTSKIDTIELREEEKHNLLEFNKVTISNYLTYKFEQKYDIIITNPPFSLAKEFIEHSINNVNISVIMLLRLSFLESQTRLSFWKKYPVTEIYVLSKRPSFTNKGTDSCAYAWFVWNKNNNINQKIVVI